MANQAGLDAVAEDALFLGGQLLVGGSSFMYLKSLHEAGPQHVVIHQQNKGLHPIFQRVNKKTCGYVMLYMTLQAVGFQAYTAYRRGQQSRLHRILSGREPVSLSPHRSLRLRLMNTAGLINVLSNERSHHWKNYYPVHLDVGLQQQQSQPQPQQQLQLHPLSARWRSVLSLDPTLFHCLAQFQATQLDAKPMYLSNSHVEHNLKVPRHVRCLVVVEAENGVELNMVGHASTVRDRISKSNRGVEVVSVVVQWPSIISAGGSCCIESYRERDRDDGTVLLINGNVFVLEKVSQWLKEVEAKEEAGCDISRIGCTEPEVVLASKRVKNSENVDTDEDTVTVTVSAPDKDSDIVTEPTVEEFTEADTCTVQDVAAEEFSMSDSVTLPDMDHNTEDNYERVFDSTRLVLEFFEWTGETLRKAVVAGGSTVVHYTGQGVVQGRVVCGDVWKWLKGMNVSVNFSVQPERAVEIAIAENVDDPPEERECSRLLVHHTGARDLDQSIHYGTFPLASFIAREMNGDLVDGSASINSQGASGVQPKVVVMGGEYEEDYETALAYAKVGYSVLLLTHSARSTICDADENGREENVSVVSLPMISQDIFLYANSLLEASFKDSESADKLILKVAQQIAEALSR